ncbi:MAG: T9SS type A sorting domain-containing protein [Elusimicrobia bacterium]|nr:T9SS type A sorting domain-containing protein [Elusimicrobiota bacterium]
MASLVTPMRYAVLNSIGWEEKILDNISVGGYPPPVYYSDRDMAIAEDGTVYVSHVFNGFSLFKSTGGPFQELLHITPANYRTSQIEVESSGRLHMAYNDQYSTYPPLSSCQFPDDTRDIRMKLTATGRPRFIFAGLGYGLQPIQYGELNDGELVSEPVPFVVAGNVLYPFVPFLLGDEDRPYIFAWYPSSTNRAYMDLRLVAKLPPPPPLSASTRTASSIRWEWPAATSSTMRGFRVRRSADNADLSGILPATATGWTQDGLGPNTGVSAYLETLYPGFVLPSTGITAYSAPFAPKNIRLARSESGGLSATWSANGNGAGSSYRLDFQGADGGRLSAVTDSSSHVYPLLSLQSPFGLNVTALAGDGTETPLARIESVTTDGHRTRMVFVVEDLTVETTLTPVAGFAHPVFAAGPANEFSPNTDPLFTPTGRGFQLEMDRPLPSGQYGSLSVVYPTNWLAGAPAGPVVLARYDSDRGVWIPLPTRQDGQRLTAPVDGFGTFQAMVRSPLPAADTVKAYPNPFHIGEGNSLVLRDVSTQSQVRVMTLNGQLIRTLSGNEAGLAEWDGRDSDGVLVESGVYIVQVTQNGTTKKLKVIVEQ